MKSIKALLFRYSTSPQKYKEKQQTKGAWLKMVSQSQGHKSLHWETVTL